MSRLLIIGPPGAGKGTQAKRIAEHLDIPAISTGDIFRSNVAKGTELGKKVDAVMKVGGYVSDELTNALVQDRLNEEDAAAGFLLDGYPRTASQVEALDAILADAGQKLDAVIELTVDEEEVIGRLLKRSETENRADDNEETIRKRQEVYKEETAPLLEIYCQRDAVVKVNGMGDIDEVTERVLAALPANS